MSRNFRLYVSGTDFPLESWQFILGVFNARPMENSPTSPWQWQWITPSRVWVTVQCLTNTQLSRPEWAEWYIVLDFSAGPVAQRFDAAAIIALALVMLPKFIPGVRLLAEDAVDDASASVLEEWALIALRTLDRQAVGDIVEWALSV